MTIGFSAVAQTIITVNTFDDGVDANPADGMCDGGGGFPYFLLDSLFSLFAKCFQKGSESTFK